MTYITIFIDTHLDAMLSQRRKRMLWENGEREENCNGFKKKIQFKGDKVENMAGTDNPKVVYLNKRSK